jgi:hypothetical protein
VHTYRSGNCLIGLDQTFAIIDDKGVNSSLEPDCPHFVLSGRVRDSSDSAKDSGDSAKDLSGCTDWDDQKPKSKIDINNILADVKMGMLGAGFASFIIISLNEVPTIDVPISFLVIFIITQMIQWYRSKKSGDDQ